MKQTSQTSPSRSRAAGCSAADARSSEPASHKDAGKLSPEESLYPQRPSAAEKRIKAREQAQEILARMLGFARQRTREAEEHAEGRRSLEMEKPASTEQPPPLEKTASTENPSSAEKKEESKPKV